MPFFPSSDVRLYVGGRPVHGRDDASHTLRTTKRTFTHPPYNRTSIGHATAQHDYLRRYNATLEASGFYNSEHGILPMLRAGMPHRGGSARPVTYTTQGAVARHASTIAQGALWESADPATSENEPVMISTQALLSNARDALFVAEGDFSGVSPVNVGNLDMRTLPIAIRFTTPRLELISGNTALLFQMATPLYDQHLRIGDDIVFDGGPLVGAYRITTATGSAAWTNVTVELPGGGTITAPLSARNQVTGVRLVDTFTGDRIAVVHLSDVQPRDAQTLEVAVQGTSPGTLNWADFGTPQSIPIAGVGPDDYWGLYFDPGDNVRSISRARIQLRFLLAGGANGLANNYGAHVRADVAPRVVYH